MCLHPQAPLPLFSPARERRLAGAVSAHDEQLTSVSIRRDDAGR